MTPQTKKLIEKAMRFCKESDDKTYILNYINNDKTNQTTNDRTQTIIPRKKVQRGYDRQRKARRRMV